MVGATGFEPATTCTPTGPGGLAPRYTRQQAGPSLGVTALFFSSSYQTGVADATARTACTAPALRIRELPDPEPALFVKAGAIAAWRWPAREHVILLRAALQAALAEGGAS
jgi:hypothetical protein